MKSLQRIIPLLFLLLMLAPRGVHGVVPPDKAASPALRVQQLVEECQLFDSLAAHASNAENKRQLTRLMAEMNSSSFAGRDIYAQYLAFYKSHVVHCHLPENLPSEQSDAHLEQLAREMNTPHDDRLLRLALRAMVESNLLNARYQTGLDNARRLLECIQLSGDRLQSMGLPAPWLDYERLWTYNYMLILHFCLHQRIDETLYKACLDLSRRVPSHEQQRIGRAYLFPVFYYLHDHQTDKAYRMHKAQTDSMRSRGIKLHDYEFELCHWVCRQRGDYERALELMNEQDSLMNWRMDCMAEQYLQETGLLALWDRTQREQQEQATRQRTLQAALLETSLSLVRLQNEARRDSIRTLQSMQRLHLEQAEASHAKALHEQAIQRIRTDMHRGWLSFVVVAFVLMVVLIVLMTVYELYLSRVNRRLSQHHAALQRTIDMAREGDNFKIQFLQNITYDMRAPQMGILGFCDVMAERVKAATNADELMPYVEVIRDNAEQLTHLMDSVLDISNLESGRDAIEKEPVAVMPLLREVIMSREYKYGRTIALRTDADETLVAMTDPQHLSRMMRLLLSNACKFAPSGDITVGLTTTDSSLLISVEDHGPGIPADKQATIFRRFVKLDYFTKGLGLGLSICQLIARGLGGSLKVDGSYKEGARFVFTQPLRLLLPPLLVWLLGAPPAVAQRPVESELAVQRLERQLEGEHDPARRVTLLLNITDIQNAAPVEERRSGLMRLLEAQRATGDTEGIVYTAINISNLGTEEARAQARSILADLPESEERRCALTYIECESRAMQFKQMSAQQKKQMSDEATARMRRAGEMDTHEHIRLLSDLLLFFAEEHYTLLQNQYTHELVNLCRTLPVENNVLERYALVRGMEISLQCEDYRLCHEYSQRLLDAIGELETYYRRQGRPYRDFSRNKAYALHGLACCQSVLTPPELRALADSIEALRRSHPNSFSLDGHDRELRIFALSQQGRWDSLSVRFTSLLDEMEAKRDMPEDATYTSAFSGYLLDRMAETFLHLDDTLNLMATRLLRLDYKRRFMRQQQGNNVQHLTLYRRILRTQSQTDRLRTLNTTLLQRRELAEDEAEAIRLEQEQRHLEEDVLRQQTRASQQEVQDAAEASTALEAEALRRQLIYLGVVCLMLLVGLGFTLRQVIRLRHKRRRLSLTEQRLQRYSVLAERDSRERSQFIENISHETRTPLNAIVGFSRQLAEDAQGVDRNELLSYSRIIEEDCNIIVTLIADVLDLSALESGQCSLTVEPHALAELIQPCADNIAHSIPQGVRFDVANHLAPHLIIHTDRARFMQVVGNLLTNACKYCAEGHIRLVVGQSDDGTALQLCVEDTGPGIDPSMADAIFHRDEANRTSMKGAGMGLRICRLLAQRLGGRIYVDTSYRGGARFVFEHPM